MRSVVDSVDGRWEAALAAYNAGLSRAKDWSTWGEFREPAEFVETVPFTQTREYIQIVLRNADIYRQLYAAPLAAAIKSQPPPPAGYPIQMGSTSEPKVLEPPAHAESRPRFRSDRASGLNESVIREMTRLAFQYNAVNLAQGFPDFPAPEILKRAAIEAIEADINQYSITWGAKPFRDAIAAKYRRHYQLDFDPEREITVVCGATEGMIASLTGVTNPGDELVVFEPFYENYGPDSVLCGCTRKLVTLHAPDWTFDRDELRRAFSHRTKAIILNSPNNPTGPRVQPRRADVHRRPLPGIRRAGNHR